MTLPGAIAKLIEKESLSSAEIEAVVGLIMDGEATPAQIGGLLVALRAKGESVQEIVGAARAMRAHSRTIAVRDPLVVDTCGTGGDGSDTFNISTAAALIAAGAGVTVAKHGNRAMSGRVGGADVLELLGVRIGLEPEHVATCVDTVGIGFLFAQVFHPAMRHAAGPRRELGVRTIFNLLGPLCNPAGARRQVVGMFSAAWVLPMAEALAQLGSEHALVVHGAGGLDEISVCGPTQVAELRDGSIATYEIAPEDFGMARAPIEALRITDAAESAAIIRAIVAGAAGPTQDIAVLNAAAAIYVAGRAASIAAAVPLAREAIRSGAAAAKLEAWGQATQ